MGRRVVEDRPMLLMYAQSGWQVSSRIHMSYRTPLSSASWFTNDKCQIGAGYIYQKTLTETREGLKRKRCRSQRKFSMRCDWCRRFGRGTSSRRALPFPGPKPPHAGLPAGSQREDRHGHTATLATSWGDPLGGREGSLVLATYGNASNPWLLLAKRYVFRLKPHDYYNSSLTGHAIIRAQGEGIAFSVSEHHHQRSPSTPLNEVRHPSNRSTLNSCNTARHQVNCEQKTP